jgi:hypothetical protein
MFALKAIDALTSRGITEIHALGDFGFVWDGSQRDALKLKRLQMALKRASATLFVTGGNHEGYATLLAIEPDENGLRWIRKNIALLPRGWRSTTEAGVTIASLGGANSIDVYSRRPAVNGRPGSWWAEEQITEADLMALGPEPTDILLGHDSPMSVGLDRLLKPNARYWDPRGLAYANIGQKMFHRGFEQVTPTLVVSGHYHLFLDTTETFTLSSGVQFTARCVVMNTEWDYPSMAVLDTSTLDLEFIRAYTP